jgi:hypothetical protein
MVFVPFGAGLGAPLPNGSDDGRTALIQIDNVV